MRMNVRMRMEEMQQAHRQGSLRWGHRRSVRILALVAVFALVATACGNGTETEPAEPVTDPTEYRIAALLSGTENDGAFSEGIAKGLRQAEQELELREVRIAGPVLTPEDMTQQASAFAEEGFDLVFIIHGALVEVVPELAERYPNTRFCGLTDPGEEVVAAQPENVCYIDPAVHNGSFMGGVAAGLASDHVGAVGAIEFPALTAQLEAFQLGARCVNPDVRYDEAYTGDFNDPARAKSAADTLYARGADILLAAVDAAVQGMFTSAYEQSGRFVVPQYFDNYDAAPDAVLTSVLFGLEAIAYEIVLAGLEGELPQRNTFTDKWSLAPFREREELLGPENLQKVEEIQQKVLTGEIYVPNDKEIGESGSSAEFDVVEDLGC